MTIKAKRFYQKIILYICIAMFIMAVYPHPRHVAATTVPGNTLSITWFSVGAGDSILIQTPGNKTILVDGGFPEYGDIVVDKLKNRGISKIDYIISTHRHDDHVGGLINVFNAFPVDNFIYGKAPAYSTPLSKKLIKTAKQEGCLISIAKSGRKLYIDGVLLKFVQTKQLFKNKKMANAGSAAIYIKYKKRTALLTGDNNKYSLGGMEYHKAELIDAPHHGSDDGYIPGFYEKIKPKFIVVSTDGHSRRQAHKKTFKRIHAYNPDTLVLRTDKLGDITLFATDTCWQTQ